MGAQRRSVLGLCLAMPGSPWARASTAQPKLRRLGVLLFDAAPAWQWLVPELRQALEIGRAHV